METFKDQNGWDVTLSFLEHSFPIKSDHVFVICRYKDKWLLTSHPQRGYEFPGGKIEEGETAEEAAKREVMEETGGVVERLHFIGEYLVNDRENGAFVKTIYFSDIDQLLCTQNYLETNGPMLIEDDLLEKVNGKKFSFIMKDNVVKRSLEEIIGRRLI
ncbi:RNA deprotection pyrophosphohydrolase [Heyndrickxia sp. NPDC080065]|uniref:RNA deprotection pyrophosphohydrolase n=1 Tax=Heyndrickxia sp. NPDC080065 TaxID=3390568 RepID=UPI003D08432D